MLMHPNSTFVPFEVEGEAPFLERLAKATGLRMKITFEPAEA